jgi:transcriptional regulator with XRE-family HTH domain|nr:MAG TPA: Helix-turn-helix XRE-family like protein [Caudoviricetes sp.]
MDTKDILKSKRKELNLSQKEVADYVGVSEATVSRWESGNIANMGRDKIALLSKILKLSPSVIAGYADINDFETPFILTKEEKELVTAYRNKPEMQSAVNTLLGISNNSQRTVEYPMAARTNAKKIKLSAQEVESLKKAKEYNEDI